VNVLNKINQIKEVKADNDVKKPGRRFFVSTGIHYNKFTYSGENHITFDQLNKAGLPVYKKLVTTRFYMPRFSAGMDWFANPHVQRLVFRGEITFSIFNSKTSTIEQYLYPDENVSYKYQLSALNVSVAPQIIWNAYNRQNLKFYIGGGMSVSYLNFGKNNMYRIPESSNSAYHEMSFPDYFKMRDTYMNLLVRSGIMLNKKVDISAMWFNPVDFSNYTAGASALVEASSLQFSIGYMFNRNR
jgi:hypothetical protein